MCQTRNPYVWLAQFVVLLGLLVLFIWLSIRPKSPNYTIVDITIPSLENGGQNGSISYALEIQNSNKDSSISYDQTLLTFFYGPDTVGEKTLPPFHQGRGRTRQVLDYVNVNPQVWNTIRNSILNTTAELKVALLTRVRYKTWGIKSKHHGINLQGLLSIGSDGKISGKKKKIKLHRASKKLWSRQRPKRYLWA